MHTRTTFTLPEMKNKFKIKKINILKYYDYTENF